MSEEKKGLLARTPLQSKKFLAAMIWNLLWLALIGYGINQQISASTLNAMVYSSGLVQCLYLGGQSAVDAFKEFLDARDIRYKQIVTDCFHSQRIIINDFAPTNPYPSCQAISIPRNSLLGDYIK